MELEKITAGLNDLRAAEAHVGVERHAAVDDLGPDAEDGGLARYAAGKNVLNTACPDRPIVIKAGDETRAPIVIGIDCGAADTRDHRAAGNSHESGAGNTAGDRNDLAGKGHIGVKVPAEHIHQLEIDLRDLLNRALNSVTVGVSGDWVRAPISQIVTDVANDYSMCRDWWFRR